MKKLRSYCIYIVLIISYTYQFNHCFGIIECLSVKYYSIWTITQSRWHTVSTTFLSMVHIVIIIIIVNNNNQNAILLCFCNRNLHWNVINHVRKQIHIVNGSSIPFVQYESICREKQTDDSIRNTVWRHRHKRVYIYRSLLSGFLFFYGKYV